MFCKKCGNEVKEGAAFCKNCGQPTEQIVSNQNMGGYTGQRVVDLSASLDFVGNFKMCMTDKYTSIQERGSRQEYWYFVLASIVFFILLLIVLMLVGSVFGDSDGADRGAELAVGIFELIMLLPMTSVTIRRLQDIGKRGINLFWGLIPIVGTGYLIVLLCQKSQEGENEYGPMPDYTKYRVNA